MIDNDWRGLDMRELNDSKRLETFHLYAQGRIESKGDGLIYVLMLCVHCKIINQEKMDP
jgi:hypothetical protein